MSYREYVIAAYAVFAAVMFWDWLSPRLQVRRALRVAHLQAQRKSAGAAP